MVAASSAGDPRHGKAYGHGAETFLAVEALELPPLIAGPPPRIGKAWSSAVLIKRIAHTIPFRCLLVVFHPSWNVADPRSAEMHRWLGDRLAPLASILDYARKTDGDDEKVDGL
jgi:hypothetical protein